MAKIYETYKDSGIAWIGKIPSDWKICRIKDEASLYTGNSIKDEEKDSYQDQMNARPYIATKDIDATYLTANYNNGLYIKETDTNFRIAPANSTLMCIEGGSAGRKKTYIDREVSFVNKLCCFAPIKGAYGKYMYYFLCSPNFEDIFSSKITGLIGGVNIPTLKNIECLLPSYKEQQTIASFLDEKCGEIDELVALQEQMISELQAYKMSVITEVVTKGLNPNIPMKVSGIDWIGDIPAEWKIAKIGNLFSLRCEKNHKSMEEVKLLSLYTGIGVFPHGEQEERGNKAVSVDGYKIVHKDDIVVNIILAWMGAIGISNYDGVTSPAYDVYIPNLAMVFPHYFHYLFRTKGIAGECYKYGRGIMMMRWRTYSTEFKQISIPYPPLQEQKAIAAYLDEKTSQIDSLIAIKQEKITELKDYKKSLIYEYVTGKKKV